MPFTSFQLHDGLLQAIRLRGYANPTAIQQEAIPAILSGADLIACAQTGSGKTAAFCLPLLQLWNASPAPRQARVLILVPTRELATQVGDTLRSLALQLAKPLKLAVLFGGVSINPQMLHLRGGADILVATPGRLLDLIRQNAVSLSAVSTLVLDEADRLLEYGFADELNQLLALLPAERQNLLFSATFPSQLSELAQQFLHSPVHINVATDAADKPDILQRAIVIDTEQRTPLLRHLINSHQWKQVLVFCASRYATELVAVKLRKARIAAEPFHGELSQGKRTQVLADFKAGRIRVIVATDVAARGIDINRLPVVINYDLPRSSDDYQHRIGRTGRAGESGLAISFISTGNEAHFRLIEKRQNIALEREQLAGFEVTATEINAEDKLHGGIKGKRPNKKDKLRAQLAEKDFSGD